jgi:hypothetical protein
MQRDELLNKWHNIIYYKNNLVYLPTLKNACSYYRSICSINQFESIKWSDIDWGRNHVVSFISDPVKKYFKGLVQDWFNIDLVEDKEVFYELLKYSTKTLSHQTFVATYHSTPLTLIYGDLVNKIDWIPLVQDIDSIDYFKRLCAEYDIKIKTDHPGIDRNESTEELRQRVYELSSNMLDIENSVFYNMFLSGDTELFKKVIENFNFKGNHWKEISWIKKSTYATTK